MKDSGSARRPLVSARAGDAPSPRLRRTRGTCPHERQRLRIAIAIEEVNRRGGQERVIAELAPRLSKSHEVHLYCYNVADIPLEGIEVRRVRGIPGRVGMRALWFVLASSVAIRPRSYDVVLSQGGNTLVQNFALAHTCQRERQRVRREVEWRYRPPGLLGRVWIALREAIVIALERRASLRCRGRLIAVSKVLAEYYVREYALKPEEVLVANNGVNHEVFNLKVRDKHRERVRAELGLREEDFVPLFLGGRWFDKGVLFVLDALSLMRQPAKALIVGSGDVPFFQQYADARGIGDRVTFVRPTDRPEAYYAAGDCFVFPSRAEGLPLVLPEAAACGLPLVCTRVGGADLLLADGVSGFFVQRDPGDIAEKLDRLASDPALREKMSEEVHQRSLQFSWDRQAREIERVFLRAVGAEEEAAEGPG